MPDDVNPYAIPDDDINELLHGKTSDKTAVSTFAEHGFAPKRSHVLDGKTPCDACEGAVHEIDGLDSLPSEVLDNLCFILDGLPLEVRKAPLLMVRSVKERTRYISDFLSFSKSAERIASKEPLIIAMAEVLNELSGGKVELRWRVYQSERELVIQHSLLQVANNMHEQLQAKGGTASQGADDYILINILGEFLAETQGRIQAIVEMYHLRAGEAGMEVDQLLIDSGRASADRRQSRFHALMGEAINIEIDDQEVGDF